MRSAPGPSRQPLHDSEGRRRICSVFSSVQLRFRLWLVPIRSRRDVLQLRLEEVVQELLLGILHLREDLARGRRSDSVYRVGVDRSLPIYRDQVCDLFRSREQLSFLVSKVQFPRALRICVSNGPCGPPEHGQKPRFALRTLRMIGHFPDPDLLVKVSTLEAEQVDRLRREVKAHSIEDFLPLRLRGEELRCLHVPTEDRIRQRSGGLLRPMNDDLDFSPSNLVNDLADSVEVRVEQEGLSDGLVVNRRVREADLQGP